MLALTNTSLVSEVQERFYNVTDIGKKLVPPLSARATNLYLENKGLQTCERSSKDNLIWKLTETGKCYGQYQNTGKKHSNGTPVQQVKWSESVCKL